MTIVNHLAQRIAQWVRTYFTASAVVGAIEVRRRPDPDDLRRLGIDPRDFLSMGHG